MFLRISVPKKRTYHLFRIDTNSWKRMCACKCVDDTMCDTPYASRFSCAYMVRGTLMRATFAVQFFDVRTESSMHSVKSAF